MTPTTFTARVTDCSHTRELPLLHSAGHVNCFVCQPELREQPIKGRCLDCAFNGNPEFVKKLAELPAVPFIEEPK
jgi:hypothetical protein